MVKRSSKNLTYALLVFLILFPMLLLLSCAEDEPIGVEQMALVLPQSAPAIDRASLLPLSTGYANGNIRSNRVTIKWGQMSGADFLCYKIFRGTSQTPFTIISKVDSTSFTDKTLNQNTYYKYTVATIGLQGTQRVDTITIKTPQFVPPVLYFQLRPDTTLRIFWNNTAESATAYKLEKRIGAGAWAPLTSTADTFFVDVNITNQTQYSYRIYAVSSYETTATSSIYPFFTNYTMGTPSLSPLQQITPTRSVRLTWTDNATGEEGYRIYRRGGTTENYLLAGTVGTNTVTFVDNDTTALQLDSMYYYYVQGYNYRDTTTRSNIRNITIARPTIVLNEGFESGLPSRWTTGGNANWFVTSTSAYAGNYSVRSGQISHSQSTYLSRTINFTGNKFISFYFRVSSEAGYDYLRFYVNGVLYNSWSGDIGWQYYSTNYFGNGAVILEWYYSKDDAVSSGQDAAWIDNVIVQ
jgi:hypothetical protein